MKSSIKKNTKYAKNLNKIMKMKNIDQRTLADKTGISQGLISFYAKGEREPGLKNALKLSMALGVTIDEMLGQHPLSSTPLKGLEGLSKEEKDILLYYRKIKDEGERQIIRMIIMSYLKE